MLKFVMTASIWKRKFRRKHRPESDGSLTSRCPSRASLMDMCKALDKSMTITDIAGGENRREIRRLSAANEDGTSDGNLRQ
jgi:hypothetical protein